MALPFSTFDIIVILVAVIIGIIIGQGFGWVVKRIQKIIHKRKLSNPQFILDKFNKEGYKYIDGVKDDNENARVLKPVIGYDPTTGKPIFKIDDSEQVIPPIIKQPVKTRDVAQIKDEIEKVNKQIAYEKEKQKSYVQPIKKKRSPFDLRKLRR